MSRPIAALFLVWRLLVEVLVSGWATARIILVGSRGLRPGFVRMPYGDLGDGGVLLLGALISLTPGTTTVDIDPERGEFLLHLLDTAAAEATLTAIERDFQRPIALLFGGRR